MKKILNYLKLKQRARRSLYAFKNFIAPGFYCLNYNDSKRLSFKKVQKNNHINMRNLKRIFYSHSKGEISVFDIIEGTEKINLINDRFVISKYLDKHISMTEIKDRIEKCLPKLCLPHNNFTHISVLDRTLISPFIRGKSYFDKEHNDILLSTYFQNSLLSDCKTVSSGNITLCVFVQHGDAYGENILWDGKNFTLIDLEGVGFYPAFYDTFLLISLISDTAQSFLDYCHNYDFYFNKFAEINGLTYNNEFLDIYISAFIFFRWKSYKKSDLYLRPHRPFVFLTSRDLAETLPRTYLLFTKLNSHIEDSDYNKIYEECMRI